MSARVVGGDSGARAGGGATGATGTSSRGSVAAGPEAGAVTVVLPGQLRELVDGAAEIAVSGSARTVGELFQALRVGHPAIYDRIFTERREVRPHVNVFVDGADVRWAGGLETPVEAGSEVVVLPAVSGG